MRFDNSTPTAINDSSVIFPVTVNNINMVGKVTVSVYITAPSAEYMLLELISPNGTASLLADGDGGTGANFGTACSPDSSRTTFDDAATQSIVNGAAPLVGTYTPETPLSAFDLMTGADVNGTWELYAYNYVGEASTLQCWSLFISPEAMRGWRRPVSRRRPFGHHVGQSHDHADGQPGHLYLERFQCRTQPGLQMPWSIMTLPVGHRLSGIGQQPGHGYPKSGPCSLSPSARSAIQSNATITVTAQAVEPGLMTSTAVVGSPASDPNPDNNEASASVLVTKPLADLALTMNVESRLRARQRPGDLLDNRHQPRAGHGPGRDRDQLASPPM